MANTTKHIEGVGNQKKAFKKLITTPPYKQPVPERTKRAIKKQKGYVSSYLDLSVNTPGKYGVDY
tara:strand:- start:5741 stop:5935 length:195 start_codon:yes stop_codon:yes gene_type:complete